MEGFLLPVEIKILDIEGPFDRMLFGRICHLVEQTIRTKPLWTKVGWPKMSFWPKWTCGQKCHIAEKIIWPKRLFGRKCRLTQIVFWPKWTYVDMEKNGKRRLTEMPILM